MTPTRTYLVCATQRSGSTLVCELLAQTGVAGAPNEHLLRWNEFMDRDDPVFWRQAVERIKEIGRSDNGVWGCKVMADYFPAAMQRLRCAPEVHDLGDWQVAQRAFGMPAVIRVRRRDRLRQAISYYIAESTGVYHMAREADARDPFLGRALTPRRSRYNQDVPFDFDAIRHFLEHLEAGERYWDDLLRAAAQPALELCYEDFLTDRKGHVRAMLQHLDIAGDGAALDFDEHLDKLSNDVNERFYQQYRARERA